MGLFREVVGGGGPKLASRPLIRKPSHFFSASQGAAPRDLVRMGRWSGGPEAELPGLNLAHFSVPLLTLAVALRLKLESWGARSQTAPPPQPHPSPTQPSGARKWLVKGGGQLENKQVVRGLSDWSPCTLPEGPGVVGEEEEEVRKGKERGRGWGFVTCHLLWLSLGRAGGGPV